MIRIFIASSFLLLGGSAFADENKVLRVFKEAKPTFSSSQNQIQARHFRLVSLDVNQLLGALEERRQQSLHKASLEVELPLADGTFKRYKLVENNTLNPKLREKFPDIKTYDAYGVSDPSEFAKVDMTPQGFHAMILKPGKSPVFIDPIQKGNDHYYIVYEKKDFISSKVLKCGVHNQSTSQQTLMPPKYFANYNSCMHKQYRLALAATAQYTIYHGGTVNDALSAQATTINRVNGVYETDMAITFQIIADNDRLIYTDPNNQPYTSGIPEILIDENQANVTAVIGPGNYDIGHVLDAAGSGLARLASVCTDSLKARGVSGSNNPIGDPFDVDYVSHEIGHQFNAQHVQNNNCNRNAPTAVEPGSGSTIMGYAGICPPNVQQNSNSYFNGISLKEMGDFVSSSLNTCPVLTPIPAAPVITATNGGSAIPSQTPFALNANATAGSAGQVLTYTWEQMDNGISVQPPASTSLDGPNFRSVPPQVGSTRFFPNLTDLSSGGPFTWEVLPSVSRKMNFRVTVRANTPGGSCNAYQDTSITTVENAGPFIVTFPSDPGLTLFGLSPQKILWNVANTNTHPIDAHAVNIFLSLDGGQSYPYPLLLNGWNDGNADVCLPNVSSSTARVMVQSVDGTFFNISQNNFSLVAVSPKAPVLTAAARNRMNTKEAFVLYGDCVPYLNNNTYTVNGLPGAVVRIDAKNRRFIISNITTPKRVRNVTISAWANNSSRTSNPITIPSIL